MKYLALVVAAIAVLSFALLVPAVSAQASGTQYVVYSINAVGPNGSRSATVNDTVVPGSNGLAAVSLGVISSEANLSYSRVVNASRTLLPIIPAIGTRSIDLTRGNYTISASVTQTGTKSVTFSGNTYSVTTYSFSISVHGPQKSVGASGQIAQFASGLIYSASVTVNGTNSVSAQLIATNVSLTSGTSSSSATSTTIAAAGVGAGGLITGVGAFVFYRKEKRSSENSSESKPLYWVD